MDCRKRRKRRRSYALEIITAMQQAGKERQRTLQVHLFSVSLSRQRIEIVHPARAILCWRLILLALSPRQWSE